jgi:two-component system cell cycle response regulator
MAADILIIEDNPANLELMRYLLSAFGHAPFHADTGAEGVRLALERRAHLILCDLQLPDIDGFEVLKRLRAQPATARIPVIAVTALAMVGDRERALAAGFDAYVAKPIDPETFVRQVESVLPPQLRGKGEPERKG